MHYSIKRIVKKSMAVPVTDEQRQKMADEDVFVSDSTTRKLPNVGIRAIKSIMQDQDIGNLDLEAVVQLPKIYFKPSEKNMVWHNEEKYILVNIEESKQAGRKPNKYWKDGRIILMDMQTGKPLQLSYDESYSELKPVTNLSGEILVKVKDAVELWNDRVQILRDRIAKNVDADRKRGVDITTLPLQLQWAYGKIEERINILITMEEALNQNLNQFSKPVSYLEWVEWLKKGVKGEPVNNGNTFTAREILDSLLFLFRTTPQQIFDASGNLANPEAKELLSYAPEPIQKAVLALLYQEMQNVIGKKEKEEVAKQEREVRLEEDLDVSEVPELRELKPPESVPGQGVSKAPGFSMIEKWKQMQYQKLMGVKENKELLTNVQQSIDGLKKYLGALESGERSRDFLRSDEGQDVVVDLREFLQDSYRFIKNYKREIVTEEGEISSRLYGREGTMGNALVAANLYRICAIVKGALDEVTVTDAEKSLDEMKQMLEDSELSGFEDEDVFAKNLLVELRKVGKVK